MSHIIQNIVFALYMAVFAFSQYEFYWTDRGFSRITLILAFGLVGLYFILRLLWG